MSINGLTKGTELEKSISAAAQAEANGVMTYYALQDSQKSRDLMKSAINLLRSQTKKRYTQDFMLC